MTLARARAYDIVDPRLSEEEDVSLLDRLVGVRLVVIDDKRRLAYAWFGNHRVYQYDEYGHNRGFLRVRLGHEPISPDEVLAFIERQISRSGSH
jgi:hypothetical protein